MQATLAKLTTDQQLELERCKVDIPYWISRHVKTYDPRPESAPHHLDFQLYPHQIEYVRWLEARYREPRDGLTEKSRDMGATWCALAWFLHHWMFDAAFQGLLGSRKEDMVDNWQMDSHFGRLSYMVERLPDWMRPEYDRRHMKLVNKANGNALIGEASTPDFARQGRYSAILLDEFAFWDWAESVQGATADATRCRLIVSTPNGSNTFKRLRASGRVAVYTLHWRAHPLKDQRWYESECGRRTPEEVAQELDISYDKSVRGRVYPEWGDLPRGEYGYQAGWPLFTSWDFGLDDSTSLVWWQRNPATGLYRIIECYSNNGRTIDFYAPFCSGQMPSGLPYQYTEADLAMIERHRGWPGAVHYGDPAGKQRNQVTGTSVIAELRKPPHNIHVQTRPDVNEFESRWQRTKLFLRRVEGINLPACAALDDAMSNARFPERRENSQATSEVSKPIHDFTSHYRTAVEYMAVNVPAVSAGVAPAKHERRKAAWESL